MTNPATARAHTRLAAYYADAAVRARIAEFLGAPADGAPFAAYGGARLLRGPEDSPVPHAPAELDAVLRDGADVLRPMADARGVLLALDVDLVHATDAILSRQPAAALALLEAARSAAADAFARYGVAPLPLLTASGYRFVARAPRDGRLYARLSGAGGGTGWAAASCEVASGRTEARAYRGAGRVVEMIAHDVVRSARAAGAPRVALAVAPPGAAPFVRVDPTAYADDPDHRYLHCAFSSDQTEPPARAGGPSPFTVVLPVTGDGRDAVEARSDLSAAAALARNVSAAIPDVPDGARLVDLYERSALAAFHAEMDHAPLAADWARAAEGLFDPESAPPCANAVLRYPSPRLLQPGHLRTVALALWSTGWHPRSIAALVRSRYEEPHDWGTHWRRHDPALTAEYYVRLFCASAALGLDDGRFSCETEARHGLCPPEGCGYDLGPLLRRLRSLRARYEEHA